MREKIAILLTFVFCLVGLFLFYGFFLQDTFKLDSLTFVGVLITAIAGIGGAYSYARSRLDKVIALLDEVRIWLYYPALRTKPKRSTYTQDDDLQEIAKHAADKVAEARIGVAGSLPVGPLPLAVENKTKIENVDVIKQ